VLGHEGIGVVEAVGAGVESLKKGDRAGLTYLASWCGACALCRAGLERYCAKQLNHGYSCHGALRGFAIVPAQNLVPVPAGLGAALAAPLCCAGWTAYGALEAAAVKPGGTVALFGMGGLGHLGVQYARHMGLRVAAVDVAEPKLELARALGAEITALAGNARNVLLKQHGGMDAAIVLTASTAAIGEALGTLKRTGALILVGLSQNKFELSVSEVIHKGIRVQGSFLGTRAQLERVFALAHAGVGRPHVEEYPLGDAPALIERLRAGELLGRAVVRF
jgi:alcohol dehydrogenase, propanol-preferring